MVYIDLSYDITHNMRVYPGDTEVVLRQDKFLAADHYNNFNLSTGMHVGTHVDSPMHMADHPLHMGDYPVDQFCGRGIVLDVRGQSVIALTHSQVSAIQQDDMVLFYTGWEERYGTSEYYSDHPVLAPHTAGCLIDRGVKLIGLDAPSPDHYPFDIHKRLFKHGIFIAENLRNLGLLVDKSPVELFMFPLKIRADASLIRAVARVNSQP
jgi:kynurenine formamidase